MSDTFGACVVLIPADNDFPVIDAGGQHITLLYLGDNVLPEIEFNTLYHIVSDVAREFSNIQHRISIVGEEVFGEGVHVITLDDSADSVAVIFRDRILNALTPELLQIFNDSETFPKYRPHMTVGFEEDGYIQETSLPQDHLTITDIGIWNGENRVNVSVDSPTIDVIKHETINYADLEDTTLYHYGTSRRSGRYPWGTGDDPKQHSRDFTGYVNELHKQGLSEVDIAKSLGMSTTELRDRKTIAKNEIKKDQADQALRMRDKGMSNVAIGAKLGMNESSVRALIAPANLERIHSATKVANLLKDQVAEKTYLDVGTGIERHMAVPRKKLDTAITMLKNEGYDLQLVKIEQVGMPGQYTLMKVLVAPGTPYTQTYHNRDQIRSIVSSTKNADGTTDLGIKPPVQVDSKRIVVNYSETGGKDRDGVIELRRGVPDISLGTKNYAQVRIAVDNTHYLKGMAMYSDDLPAGADFRFNTNKSNTGNKLDAMKALKDDPDNPFGAVIYQKKYIDDKGKEKLSPLNIVNEEGEWATWSKSLSSQMLSKQTPVLAKRQLGLALDERLAEYGEISQLTNPVIKKKLLETYADECDSAATHLKAAAMPRQRNSVILPIPSLKENEVYAPNFNNGERVVLIRHPHGGVFEIPELVVNNKNSDAKKTLGTNTIDAIGIHPKVAERLSGADFDGDTVLVIPILNQIIKTAPHLKGLKDFDPQEYKDDTLPKMSTKSKATQMGNISNLITDMTIKKANEDEIARAVRHSMVVIDAEKHNLDYKRSAKENNIGQLKAKYQKGPTSGASTLISLAGSDTRVMARKERSAKEGGHIDPITGQKMYTPTGASYVIPAHTKTGKRGNEIYVPEKTVDNKVKSNKMAETTDAFTLSSGTPMEAVYATHANKLKAMANNARKEALFTKPLKQSDSAKVTYKPEMDSLKTKLNIALMNAPLERQAQVVARAIVDAKRKANPGMDAADIKKVNGQALNAARDRVGAKKTRIDITPKEWEAIQSGATSNHFLTQIVNNTDVEKIRALATPRSVLLMTPVRSNRAKAMLEAGHTQAEVAAALGVSVSTLNNTLNPKGA